MPQHREELVVTDLDADGWDDILLTDGRSLTVMKKVASELRAGAGPIHSA